MTDVLVYIKRLVIAGHYAFAEKATIEMEADGLSELDVVEAIVNAVAIYKTIRSTSPRRTHAAERLYVIQSTNLNGVPIYTKGKIISQGGRDSYYFLISSKRAL